MSAKGDRVAIAWFSGAQNMPRVQMVFSSDGGSTFSKPVLVSTGRAFGYTSVALDEAGGATVSWLEQGGAGARVLARQVSATSAAGPVIQVAEGSRQSLGYPRLLQGGNETWIAWGTAAPKLQTARLMK